MDTRVGGVASTVEATTDWSRALAWRMDRQFLRNRAGASDIVTVVARLAGLHAQVWSSSVAALAVRTDQVDTAALAAALWSDRSLAKLWAMRGTLHLLPAADHPTWVAGLDMYRHSYAHYGMRDPDLLRLAGLINDTLRGRMLTRTELAHGVRTTGQVTPSVADALAGGWGSALKPASFLGFLCHAPGAGGRIRFTSPSTWLGPAPVAPDTSGALQEITRRYLGAYAPATTQDLAVWWGVSARLAGTMVNEIRSELAQVKIDERCYWVLRGDVDGILATAPVTADDPVVRLLPSFDPWVVAGNRLGRPGIGNPTLDPAFRSAVYQTQGRVSPVVTVNGRIVGTWSDETLNSTVRGVTPFEPLASHEAAGVSAAVEALRARQQRHRPRAGG